MIPQTRWLSHLFRKWAVWKKKMASMRTTSNWFKINGLYLSLMKLIVMCLAKCCGLLKRLSRTPCFLALPARRSTMKIRRKWALLRMCSAMSCTGTALRTASVIRMFWALIHTWCQHTKIVIFGKRLHLKELRQLLRQKRWQILKRKKSICIIWITQKCRWLDMFRQMAAIWKALKIICLFLSTNAKSISVP